ncbi:Hsp70 protein [Microbacterium telephonicum]|uniref:Hsp70 protein n=1 Tax=Microbacterium telephonicum TaxID=1714841 RepID=A0A498C6E8_9MICO|nr:Hsp70 protein [Microbacterium telephonicum]
MHVAVDVGTSSTSAAIGTAGDDGTVVRALRLGRGGDTASSAVFVSEDDVLHGDAAERRGVGEPTRLIRGVKRRVGDPVPFTVAGRTLTAEELFARTVGWVVTAAGEVGLGVRGVTVTVPAAWGAHRRDGVRAAIERHGITVAAMPSEPEAAAAHYAATHDIPPGAVLAVYDLGAGTFDLAFVRVGEPDEPAVVLHSEGIDDLGGADFDDAVVDHVLSSADLDHAPGAAVTLAAVRRECVAAKEALSFDADALIPLLDGSGRSVRIVRSEFEAMIEADIERTVDAFGRARDRAGLRPDDIHAIVLSGGSSRIPRVAQLLSEAFDVPLQADADPKAVVALGAARLGADAARRRTVLALPSVPADADAAVLHLAPRPPRWRVAMTSTAAAAALLGGATFGGSAMALSVVAAPDTSVAAGADDSALPLQNPFLPLPVSEVAEGADPAVAEPAPPAVAPPVAAPPAAEADTPVLRPPLKPGVTPKAPPAPRAVERLLTPTSPAPQAPGAAPENRPPEARPSADRPPAVPPAPPAPTPTPVTEPEPAGEPEPTTPPEPQPTSDPEPTQEPQPEPTQEPQPEPTQEPQPEPTTEPEPQPTQEPSPEPQPTEPDPSPPPGPEPSPTEAPVPI